MLEPPFFVPGANEPHGFPLHRIDTCCNRQPSSVQLERRLSGPGLPENVSSPTSFNKFFGHWGWNKFPRKYGLSNALQLSDQLENVIRRPKDVTTRDTEKEAVMACWGINQTLRLLSITAAIRPGLRGEIVSFKTLQEDRYRKEFEKRYEMFLKARWPGLT